MLLTLGNHKLSKRIAVFSLSAGKEGTCNRNCNGCFALKTEKLRKEVRLKRQMITCLARLPQFPFWIEQELDRLKGKITAVRVHEGGDFFDGHYVMKWFRIAFNNPKVLFYAYTKRAQDLNLKPLAELPNFVLIDSLKPRGGKPNFADRKTLKTEGGHFICPWQKGMKCGSKCTYCLTKQAQEKPPVFVKH
jgi:sulfatase maturation enzyme AslB (radical SAM superfamily)